VKKLKLGYKWLIIFPTNYLLSYLQGYLTRSKILRHGDDGFTSPPKEFVPRIFNAIENPSASAGFEPENFGSNGKHANHLTTEGNSYNANIQDIHQALPKYACK
jgi:hypothetical protein